MISGFSVISPIRVWSSQIGLRKRRKCANDVRRFVKMFAFLKTNSHVSGFFQISSSWLRFLSSFFESFFSGTLYIKPQPNPEPTSTSGEVGPNSAGGFFLDKSHKKILCGDFLASPVDFFVTIEISLIILCSGTKISKSQFGKLRNIRLHSGIS